MMRASVRFVCMVSVSLCAAGCSKSSPENPDVLAKVGDRTILVADLQAEAQRRVASGRPVGDKAELLKEMVQLAALRQKADHSGLLEDPAARREVDNLIVGMLKDRELLPQLEAIKISDEEVKREYESRLADYTRPAQVRLAGLVLNCPASASAETKAQARARLEEARRQVLAAPAPGGRGPAAQGFGAVAINCTDDQVSRYRGGDLGWLKTPSDFTRWPASVVESGFRLPKGQISDVIEADDGFYLIMKSDERPAVVTPLEKVQAGLRRKLEDQQRRAVATAYVEEVVRTAGPTVNDARLASVELPSPPRNADAAAKFQPPVMSKLETNAHGQK